MPRRFLSDFNEREKIREVFILGDKQMRQNRNGDLYLQMRLSDRSGSCSGMFWNVDERTASDVSNGDYVEIEGMTQFYNGALQIIVKRIDRAEPGGIDEEDFILIDQEKTNRDVNELTEKLLAMRNVHLRTLAQSFLKNESFMARFTRAPAAVKNHHAYHGGLLEHVVQLTRLAEKIAEEYDQIDRDLLIMGVFLHDVGKIEELTYERDLGYSDIGQLVGHLVIGVTVLDHEITRVRQGGYDFPEDLAIQLQHMIVSHHGKYEFGSPKVPMTLEATALHYLDDLDAKIHNFHQLMQDDTNVESNWTTYYPQLGRKLFKGNP